MGGSPWEAPSGGVLFDGGDNFGSTLYDSLMDGIHVMLIVCDDCLKERKDRLLEWYRGTNDGRPNDEADVTWFAVGRAWPDEQAARAAWEAEQESGEKPEEHTDQTGP